MKRTRPGLSQRVRAYALTLVTTGVVLLFALAEWATERFVSEVSRAASTAIEITIVVIATLIFRPIHQRVEAAVEAAFHKRKRQALVAMQKFRRELSSFNDAPQLLRRVIEAVEHHLEAAACAIYLRRESFRAEASSFEQGAQDVCDDDPLAVRLRSSGAPAHPAQLKSCAPGTHAFAMTAAGELIGFLSVQCKYGDFDADETQMFTGLAGDLAAALVMLDPLLRPRGRTVPNNIPSDLPVLIGRDRELAEIKAALEQSRLVTITGPGGVGKTSIALRCAADTINRFEHGAWFVNLAPLTNGELVVPTMLAALGGGAAEPGGELKRLVEFLSERHALIVIDNCEQVLADAAAAIKHIRANSARITFLITSREMLHLHGEQLYRLGAMRTEAAIQLFAQRAAAVSPGFDPAQHGEVIRNICEHLDGIPLAIELAAARARALSVEETLSLMDERFRLLREDAPTADPRQKTLASTIEWSYEILTAEEQSLFRRLGVFRGSFSLAAAAAVCARGGECDEYHVLDVMTSLADKSLLNVTVGVSTRYRLLETIREFATQKATQAHEIIPAREQHTAHFAAVAAHAYHEFDSRMPRGWLDRLAPDIDNFRAALAWTLERDGNRQTGAQMAADCAPVFLRLDLLGEGLRWCNAALAVPDVRAQTAARIHYVMSMMYNNLAQNNDALTNAECAVTLYQTTADERGLIRSLSQTAQLYARSKRFDEARKPAAEAIRRARLLGEARVLVAVLRRCAYSLPDADIDTAREYFAQALTVARDSHDPEEISMVLRWWASREAGVGRLERALELGFDALACADGNALLEIELDITGWALALGRFDEARPHAENAVNLARSSQDRLRRAAALAFSAPFHAERNPREALQLFQYSVSRMRDLGWQPEADDTLALSNVCRFIEGKLQPQGSQATAGATPLWSEDEALAIVSN